jgi:predicted RNase H-like HicB family nuclease
MAARYNVLLTWDAQDRAWVAYVPTLDWLSTYGASRAEALERAREAVLGYLEAAAKEGLDVPPGDTKAELTTVEVG